MKCFSRAFARTFAVWLTYCPSTKPTMPRTARISTSNFGHSTPPSKNASTNPASASKTSNGTSRIRPLLPVFPYLDVGAGFIPPRLLVPPHLRGRVRVGGDSGRGHSERSEESSFGLEEG